MEIFIYCSAAQSAFCCPVIECISRIRGCYASTWAYWRFVRILASSFIPGRCMDFDSFRIYCSISCTYIGEDGLVFIRFTVWISRIFWVWFTALDIFFPVCIKGCICLDRKFLCRPNFSFTAIGCIFSAVKRIICLLESISFYRYFIV